MNFIAGGDEVVSTFLGGVGSAEFAMGAEIASPLFC
jgi:hypothetical protein